MSQISDRALRAIAGKDPMAQLDLLREYVEQAERDQEPIEQINIVRRNYIRIASAVYRGVYVS